MSYEFTITFKEIERKNLDDYLLKFMEFNRKNVMKIDRLAVFIDISIGDQSMDGSSLFPYSPFVNPYSSNTFMASSVLRNSTKFFASSA